LIGLPGSGLWILFQSLSAAEDKPPLTIPVKRGDYRHTIKVKGVLESSVNADVKCEVPYIKGWRPTIDYVIEEGTYVQPGDVVLRIDTSFIEDQIRLQQIHVNEHQADLQESVSHLEAAKEKLKAYIEGEFQVDRMTRQQDLRDAREEVRKAKERYLNSLELYQEGFLTDRQLEADRFALINSGNNFTSAKITTQVLEKYTRERRICELESEIARREARVNLYKRIVFIRENDLKELKEHLEKCELRAPVAGNVVLAHLHHHGHSHWIRVGETTRPGRTVIRLPDPKAMQIAVNLKEDVVGKIDTEMSAVVTFDALPNVTVDGWVESIDEYPKSDGFMQTTVKQFASVIALDKESAKQFGPEVRPGLTADVEIIVDDRREVLIVPSHAVLHHGEKTYCLTYTGPEEYRMHPVSLAADNGVHAVIESGITEGVEVILGAESKRDSLVLPELPEDEKIASLNEVPSI
jgi:multidrug resistance efflux pump